MYVNLQISEKQSHIILFSTFAAAVTLVLANASTGFYWLLSGGLGLIISPFSLNSHIATFYLNGFSSKDHIVSLLSIAVILLFWASIALYGICTKGIILRKRIPYLLIFITQSSTAFFYIRVILMGESFYSLL